MQILICGAGRVGRQIGRVLANEGNDVTVIDIDEALIERVTTSSDMKGIVGYASHPDVLEKAGASGADLLIAATASDEVNIVACEIASALFRIPKRIARIRAQSYLAPVYADLFLRERLPIDTVISPEIEVAKAVARRVLVPGAFDMIPLADDKVRLVGIHCDPTCPILDTPLRQLTALFPDLRVEVVAILRHGRTFIPAPDDTLIAGDDVYVVSDTKHLVRVLSAFGHDETAHRRIVILGAGNIGLALAQQLDREAPGMSVKIIEASKPRAELVAQQLPRATVLHGDALDPDMLEEANIAAAESVIAVTNDDEANILASLLAKRGGARRSVTLLNKKSYAALTPSLSLDVIVSPSAITVSSILQQVRRGRIRSVHSLRDNVGEIVEAEALETSSLVKTPLGQARLPDGTIVGALVRGDEVIIPRADTRIRPHDDVIIFATKSAVRSVERLFAVRLEYF
jgi:trk system potassium uptake protein TrkA